MENNILKEYEEFISVLKSEIESLKRKFRVCRSILEYDYSNSEIYDDEYKKVKSLRIDDYRDDIDKRYDLSKEDILFLKDYAEIDEHGNISSNLVKEKYLQKYNLIKSAFKSVHVHNYFNQLDTYSKKEKFVELVSKYFDDIVKRLESLASEIIIEEKKQEKDREIKIVLEKKKRLINRIYGDDNEFSSLVDLFFGTDVYYYNWFRKKEVEQEYNNGFVYDECVESSIRLNDNIIAYENLLKENQELINRKSILATNLSSFSAELVDLDFSDFLNKSFIEKMFSFLKEEKNNKYDLFRLFSDFSLVEGTLMFFRELSGPDTIININKCFIKYFNKTYGENEQYVEEDTFIRKIIDDIISFYARKIKELDDLLMEKQNEIALKSESVRQLSESVKKETELQRDIFTYRKNGWNYVLDGLTKEEELRLFLDIKEHLVIEVDLKDSIDKDIDLIALKKV